MSKKHSVPFHGYRLHEGFRFVPHLPEIKKITATHRPTKCINETFLCAHAFSTTNHSRNVHSRDVHSHDVHPCIFDRATMSTPAISVVPHVRWSTVLYCEPAHLYEEVEPDTTTSQTLYFDLPINKRGWLYTAYQELVCYMPWKNSPEESFLSLEVWQQLNAIDPELENRYSLMKLEAFQQVYKDLWLAGKVAPEHSQWHRDNQYYYTTYLTTLHNSDIRQDRLGDKGIFTAKYEAADELTDIPIDRRPPINDEINEADVPSVLNFLSPDVFRDIIQQNPLRYIDIDICVAFPLQHSRKEREEMIKSNKNTLFVADPPPPTIMREKINFWHNKAIDLEVSGAEQVIYIYGKAGSGKTEVALHICQAVKGRVQLP